MEASGGRPQFGSDEYGARVGEVAEGIRRRGLDAVVAWSRGGGTRTAPSRRPPQKSIRYLDDQTDRWSGCGCR